MNSFLRFCIEHFPDLLDLNLIASVVILFVICVREFMKGAPKIFSYALWGIVLLRLLVPVSIESPVSFVPQRTEFSNMVEVNEVLPEIQFETPRDREDNAWHRENTAPGEPLVQTYRSLDAQTYLTFAWLAGIAIMLLHGGIAYGKLRKKIKVVIPYKNRIYLADDIDTPFVMGFFRPEIYLPGTLNSAEREYIIAHEKHHIRRGDHIFKALGFLALTIHWFNPFVWAAFILAGRDMEMSCDEAVIRKLGENVRAEYSASLLNLATGQRMFTGTPLAFGEGNPTGRVRNLAKWKKPALWVVLICLAVCILLAVCLLTDPERPFPGAFEQYLRIDEKAELLSGRSQEEYADAQLKLVFNGSSGPVQLKLELWYQESSEEAWVLEDAATLQIQDSCEFRIPSGSTFAVAVTAEEGQHGYADFTMTSRGWIMFDKFEHDLLTSPNTKSADAAASAWTVPVPEDTAETAQPTETAVGEYQNWAVSTQVHDVTPENLVLTYHSETNDPCYRLPGYSLQRWQDGQWIQLDVGKTWNETLEQVDFAHQSQPGNGMFIQWDGIGSLPKGQYLIGQEFCTAADLSQGQRFTVYASFEISGESGGIKPLEDLPELYSGEQAMLDGCLVSRDGEAMENVEAFRAFADSCNRGEAGFFRIVNWYYGENSYYIAFDLEFDGSKYTITWLEDGRRQSADFRYLKHFIGVKERENMAYDGYERYVLVNEEKITWQEIYEGLVSSQHGGTVDHMTVFSDYYYYPQAPDLPDKPDYAILEFMEDGLITVTDSDRLEKLIALFENAEYLGYEPKTHSIGMGLKLIFASAEGDCVIELDPDSDLCRINGEYVWYGKADEPDYIEKLWEYLGITQWPDIVYTVCANAYPPNL